MSGCRAVGVLELGSGTWAQRLLGLVPAHWWVGLVPAHWWVELGPVVSDWTIAFALVCGIGSWTL